MLITRLRDYLPDGDRITGVRAISTGHSNETYLLEGLDMVLRLPPSEAPLVTSGHDVKTQYELLAELGKTLEAPPVPSAIHYCGDDAVLRAPFYVMERVRGVPFEEYAVPAWLRDADEQFRDRLCASYVDAIAAVNSLPSLTTLGSPRSNQEELARWRAVAVDAQSAPLVALFDRLRDVAPPPAVGPTLVHGDAKPGNTVWCDGELSALLDWEMAFNGDPRWDLGYVLIFLPSDLQPGSPGWDLPGMWGRKRLVAEWERRTRRAATDLGWFEAASAAKITAILEYGVYLHRTGRSSDDRMQAWEPVSAAMTGLTEALVELVEATYAASRTR